jgi:hypothetical protein
MKTGIVYLFGMLFITSFNLNKKEKAETLFTDPVMQDEIFNAILNDTTRLADFMNKFHSQQRQKMGSMHQRMMKQMCCTGADSIILCDRSMEGRMMRHMLRQTDRDSMFCKQVGDSVLRHDRLRKHLHQRMGSGQNKRSR